MSRPFALTFLLLSGCSLSTMVLKREAPPAVIPRLGALVGLAVERGHQPFDEHLYEMFEAAFGRAGVEVRPCGARDCPPGTQRLVSVGVEPFGGHFDCAITINRLLEDDSQRRVFMRTVSGETPELAVQACVDWVTRARLEKDTLFLVTAEDLEPGVAAATAGRLDEAVAFFREAAGRHPTAKAWLDLAMCLELLDKMAEAEEAFQKALTLEPHSLRVDMAHAEFLERAAQHEELVGLPPRLRLAPGSR